ncbi:hypothetical protein FISHEDRAFT_73366 [Fistulina hepatica ATCC 64428]|uniref:FHA domain-containing protein n=1 Tax=Fistulina hepatica ATCC 64428 TaxID=1128425 RepID=A0A0D7ACX4_9AGAR|nr:hypothetical protein FISHEDRAFT_73366 [Fistulina hepatica ATCC 64428]
MLAPAPESIPFGTKYVALTSNPTLLGSYAPGLPGTPPPQVDNGIFMAVPLSLGSAHAELWCEGGKVYIRDMDSAFGTFINDRRISGAAVLHSGDSLRLGSPIARNSNTPCDISDDQLKAVIARVSLSK